MDSDAVRERAAAFCDALLAGDMERAAEELSRELRSNLGPLVSILPLPLTGATIESVERAGTSGFNVVLNLIGESDAIRLNTRWKDRDGRPTVVEASHLTEAAAGAAGAGTAEPEAESEREEAGG
jgi:hypothetical protein